MLCDTFQNVHKNPQSKGFDQLKTRILIRINQRLTYTKSGSNMSKCFRQVVENCL